MYPQNDRLCLGPIETCYSGPKAAVLHTKTTGGVLDTQRLLILVLKSRFSMHKTTGEGWNPYGLDILALVFLMLSTVLHMHKRTGHVWDP